MEPENAISSPRKERNQEIYCPQQYPNMPPRRPSITYSAGPHLYLATQTYPDSYHVDTFPTEQHFSLDEPQLDEFSHRTKMKFPCSLVDHDNVGRTQGDRFVLRLNGGLEGLPQDQAHFNLARLVIEIDTRFQAVNRDIDDVEDEIREIAEQFEEIVTTEAPLKQLVALSQDLEDALVAHRGRIAKSIKELQDTLGQMGWGSSIFMSKSMSFQSMQRTMPKPFTEPFMSLARLYGGYPSSF
ncbi:hypothetical protein BDN72DRAFT_485301 [Pluteus cervinus]|uniref:Uncharacterized protein n=1 Tax=Pluteus cervinus TaxID=181527 RepID=A0ACD3A664_9AGAR|nr:hypothetical protein BDN72DRAFT_485301 [Pluteus cervinus]